MGPRAAIRHILAIIEIEPNHAEKYCANVKERAQIPVSQKQKRPSNIVGIKLIHPSSLFLFQANVKQMLLEVDLLDIANAENGILRMLVQVVHAFLEHEQAERHVAAYAPAIALQGADVFLGCKKALGQDVVGREHNAHSREREGKNHDLVGRHPLAVEKQRQASHNDAGKKDRTGARHEILKHNDRNKQPLQESTDAVTVVEQQDEDQERGRPRNGCTGAVSKAIGSGEVGVGIKLVEINHGNQHRDIHHIVERLDHISRLEIGDHPYSRQAYPLPEHTHHRGKLHIVDQEVDNSGNDKENQEEHNAYFHRVHKPHVDFLRLVQKHDNEHEDIEHQARVGIQVREAQL